MKVSILVISICSLSQWSLTLFSKTILLFAEAHPIIPLTTLESDRRHHFTMFSRKVLVRTNSPLSNQVAGSLFSYEPAYVQERDEKLLSLSIFDQDNATGQR